MKYCIVIFTVLYLFLLIFIVFTQPVVDDKVIVHDNVSYVTLGKYQLLENEKKRINDEKDQIQNDLQRMIRNMEEIELKRKDIDTKIGMFEKMNRTQHNQLRICEDRREFDELRYRSAIMEKENQIKEQARVYEQAIERQKKLVKKKKDVENLEEVKKKVKARLMLVLSTFWVAIVIIAHETGIINRLHTKYTRKEIATSLAAIVEVNKNMLWGLRILVIIVYLILQILTVWFFCCQFKTFLLATIQVVVVVFIEVVFYSNNTICFDYVNGHLNHKQYNIKGDKVNLQNNMTVMSSVLHYTDQMDYSEFIGMIMNNNPNYKAVVQRINSYALDDVSLIANRYRNALNQVNGVFDFRMNRNFAFGYTSLMPVIVAGRGTDAIWNHVLQLSEQLNRRVVNDMSDEAVFDSYIQILVLIAYLQNRNDLAQIVGLQILPKDRFLRILTGNIRSSRRFLKYEIRNKRYVEVKVYDLDSKVEAFTVSNSNTKSMVQFISNKSLCFDTPTVKNQGEVKIKAKNAYNICTQMEEIEPDLIYKAEEVSKTSHPLSHYLSKILHMSTVNNILDYVTDKIVMDVGSNFCDINLGSGVYYNLAAEEDVDIARIRKYLPRIQKYVARKKHGINVFFGDITEMDLKATKVVRYYMHNCVYNIDLGKMIYAAEFNRVDEIVTMTQLAKNVTELVECENTMNEMVYSYKPGNNESTFSTSNMKLFAVTEASQYLHNVSTVLDWFVINSVHLQNVYWNKNIEMTKYGYYHQVWYRSEMNKQEHETLNDNEDTMDCVIVEETEDTYRITFGVRPKLSNVNDVVFSSKYVITARDQLHLQELRNHVKEKPEIKTVACSSLREIMQEGVKTDHMYYRTIRDGTEQVQVEMMTDIIDDDRWFESVGTEHYDFDLDALLHLMIDNHRQQAFDELELAYKHGYQLNYVQGRRVTVYRNKIATVKKNIYVMRKGSQLVNMEAQSSDFSLVEKNFADFESFYQSYMLVVNDSKEHQREEWKDLNVKELVDQVNRGQIGKKEVLKTYKEVETTVGQRGNQQVVKEKEYILDAMAGTATDTRFIEAANGTGLLTTKAVTSFVVVNVDTRSYYDPFNVLDVVNDRVRLLNDVNRHLPKYLQDPGGHLRNLQCYVNGRNGAMQPLALPDLCNDNVLYIHEGKKYWMSIQMLKWIDWNVYNPRDLSDLSVF